MTRAGWERVVLVERAVGWVPQSASTLEQMMRAGYLTEAEVYEVRGVLDLVISQVRADEMSVHFANWLINKLADEMAAQWCERNRGA